MLTAGERTALSLQVDELKRQLRDLVEVTEVRLSRVAAVIEGSEP